MKRKGIHLKNKYMNWPIFCNHKAKGFYYFRIKGYGLVFRDIREVSENRNIARQFYKKRGTTNYVIIFNWLIKLLYPGVMHFGSFQSTVKK